MADESHLECNVWRDPSDAVMVTTIGVLSVVCSVFMSRDVVCVGCNIPVVGFSVIHGTFAVAFHVNWLTPLFVSAAVLVFASMIVGVASRFDGVGVSSSIATRSACDGFVSPSRWVMRAVHPTAAMTPTKTNVGTRNREMSMRCGSTDGGSGVGMRRYAVFADSATELGTFSRGICASKLRTDVSMRRRSEQMSHCVQCS